MGPKEYKFTAFADDLLFTLSHPWSSIPGLVKVLEDYSYLSNFHINTSKSVILNISIPASLELALKNNFPFSGESVSIPDLGMSLPSDLTLLFKLNFQPLAQSVEYDLHRWLPSHTSWFDRVAIVKMNILPRLLYLMQTIPIKLLRGYHRNLQKAITQFVWTGTKP